MKKSLFYRGAEESLLPFFITPFPGEHIIGAVFRKISHSGLSANKFLRNYVCRSSGHMTAFFRSNFLYSLNDPVFALTRNTEWIWEQIQYSKKEQYKKFKKLRNNNNVQLRNSQKFSDGNVLKFCPDCLSHQLKDNDEGFFLSILQIQGLRCCPEHGRALIPYYFKKQDNVKKQDDGKKKDDVPVLNEAKLKFTPLSAGELDFSIAQKVKELELLDRDYIVSGLKEFFLQEKLLSNRNSLETDIIFDYMISKYGKERLFNYSFFRPDDLLPASLPDSKRKDKKRGLTAIQYALLLDLFGLDRIDLNRLYAESNGRKAYLDTSECPIPICGGTGKRIEGRSDTVHYKCNDCETEYTPYSVITYGSRIMDQLKNLSPEEQTDQILREKYGMSKRSYSNLLKGNKKSRPKKASGKDKKPKSKKKKGTPKVLTSEDYAKRDEESYNCILAALPELKKLGAPKITVNSLIKRGLLHSTYVQKSEHFPKCQELLEEITETTEDFHQRRTETIVRDLIEKKKLVTPFKATQEYKISSNAFYEYYPEFEQLIQEQFPELHQLWF